MKVKGWVVIEKDSKSIWEFCYFKNSAETVKKQYEEGHLKFNFDVKPCTITIHDKAVGK